MEKFFPFKKTFTKFGIRENSLIWKNIQNLVSNKIFYLAKVTKNLVPEKILCRKSGTKNLIAEKLFKWEK